MQVKQILVATSVALTALVLSSNGSILGLLPASAADSASALSSLGANTVADIAQSAAPAVVNIEVLETSKASNPFAGLGIGGLSQLPPGFQFFFNGKQMTPQDLLGQGGGGSGHGGGATPKDAPQSPKFERRDTGSGFIVRPNGYIVTNAHVVKDAEKIKVTLNDKRVLTGKVIGTDYFSDLAVIKIEAENLPTLKMGTSATLRPGEFAICIGSPLGYDHTVTLGIISAVGRSVTDVNGNINFIQTDAAINPGNSGGPLLNLQGEVVGVNTAIRKDAQNIGFSIPVDIAKQVADSLIASGKILRPWLGIQMHELDEPMAKSLGVTPGTKGVAVVGFVEGSPAKSSGLELGDVIQKIDGTETPTPKEVKDYVQSRKVSDVLHFLVMRKGGIRPIAVNVGDYSDMMDKSKQALVPKVKPSIPDDE